MKSMSKKSSLLYENSVGIKFFCRNKARSTLGMAGIILATTIVASIFLISSNQVRITTLSRVKEIVNPIIINAYADDGPINSTELDDFVQEVQLLDSQLSTKISRIHYNIQIKSKYENSYIFPTFNSSIDWDNLSISSTEIFDNLKFNGDNAPSLENFNDLYSNVLVELIIQGHIPSHANEILVSKLFSDEFALNINDTINFGFNGTFRISSGYKITGIYTKNAWYPGVIGTHRHYIYMDNQTIERLLFDLNGSYLTFTDHYLAGDDGASIGIFIDTRGIDIYNINTIIQELTILANLIQSKIDSEGLNYHVTNLLDDYNDPIWLFKEALSVFTYILILLAFVFPIIVLSIYFSYLLNNEILERRKKEFAQLRSKGFSQKQLKRIITPEIVLSALIVTTIASILGIGISYIFQNFITNFSEFKHTVEITYMPFYTVADYTTFFGFVCMFSFIFTSLIYFKPLEKVKKTEIIKNLQERIENKPDSKRKRSSLIALIIGIIPIIGQIIIIIINQSGFVFFTSVYEYFFSTLFCFSPFLIGFYVIDALTRKYSKLFSKVNLSLFPRLPSSMKHMISRNIALKSHKIGQLMLILMFTIGFSVLSQVAYKSMLLKTQYDGALIQGSDVKAHAHFNFNDSVATLNNFSAIETIANFTPAVGMGIRCDAAPELEHMYAVKYDLLFDTINLDIDSFLVETNKELLSTLSQNQTVAIAPLTAKNDCGVGEIINVEVPVQYYNGSILEYDVVRFLCLIGGYYKAIPGIVPLNSQIERFNGQPLIVNIEPFALLNESFIDVYTLTIIIKSNSSRLEDISTLKQELISHIPSMTFTTLNDTIEQQMSSSILNSLNALGFFEMLTLDTWMMFFISILSIGILIISRIKQERREIALIRVKGFIRKQISQIYLIEYLTPVLFAVIGGLVIGVFTGWILSANFVQSFTFFHPNFHILAPLYVSVLDILSLVVIPFTIIAALIIVLVRRESKRTISTILSEDD